MPISYVGGKVAGTAGTGGGSIAINTGLTGGSGGAPLAGDLVVVTVSVGTAARAPTLAISTPTGYTALTAQRTTATTYDTNVQTCYKVMTATPDTAVTIPASGNNADGIAYAIQVFRGVDVNSPMDSTPTYATGTAVSNRPDPAAITPVSAGAWIVCCGGGASATGTTLYTAAALTNFLSANGADTNDGTVGVGYYTGWTSGAYNPAGFLGGSTVTTSSWGATTLALRPAPNRIGLAPGYSATSATAALTTAPVGAELVNSATGTDTVTLASWVQAGDVAICMAFRDGSATPPTVTSGYNATQQSITSGYGWTAVAYGNGLFVAVCFYTTVYATSPDGVTWTSRTWPLRTYVDIIFAGGLFVVALDSSNTVLTSPDGLTWTTVTLPTSATWAKIAYGGGHFVMTSQYSYITTSPDGINWTNIEVSPGDQWFGAGYGNGQFVITSNNSNAAATSPDGTTWTLRTLPSASAWQYVSFGAGLFIAKTSTSNVGASSADGITWSTFTIAGITNCTGVVYGGSRFVMATGALSSASTSTDGLNWSVVTLPEAAGGSYYCLAYNAGVFCILSQDLAGVSATLVFDNWVILDSSGSGTSSSLLAYEVLGAGGAQTIGPFTNATSMVCNVYSGATLDPTTPIGTYAVNSGTGTTVTLPALATAAPTSFAVGLAGHQSTDITWPIGGAQTFVTAQTLPSNLGWGDIAYGGGIFAVIVQSASNAALSSTDGVTWTPRTMPSTNDWGGVAYGNGIFVAVPAGPSSAAASSTDGINWTARGMPSSRNWIGVTYGNGVFVAIARSVSNAAAISSNGINWTASTMPSSQEWWAITYGNGIFVAVAFDSTVSATSPNGITWTTGTLPSSSFWTSVAYGNGVFVAAGSHVAARSTDGVNWTSIIMPSDSAWTEVSYGGGNFLAIASGTTAAASSTNGVDWTALSMPSISGWQAAAYGNGYHAVVTFGYTKAATIVFNRPGYPIRRAQQIDATDAIVVYDTAGVAT